MKTARDGILARARQQRGRVRALLQRHALTLRVAGESAPFLSVASSSPQERAVPRRRFYRPIPLATLPFASPEMPMVIAGDERILAPEIGIDEPAISAEPIAENGDAVSPSMTAIPQPPARTDAPRQPEIVSHSDSTVKDEAPSPLPEASPTPLPAPTQLERIKAMMGQVDPAVSTSVPPSPPVITAVPEVPEKAIETVLPPPNRRRRRFEEVTPGEQPNSPPAESRPEAVIAEASETVETSPVESPMRLPLVPPRQVESEIAPLAIPPVMASTPVEDADALFTPVSATEARTPAAWLARLKATASVPPDAPTKEPNTGISLPSSPQETPPLVPIPVSQTARRILRPLVGIDPADVPIYRGAEAREAAQTLGADAFAVEDKAIVLGRDAEIAGDDTPETLALLAHELTHIAQARTPRFVPPILAAPSRSIGVPTAQPASRTQTTVASTSVESNIIGGEGEAMAQQVESRVRHYAATRTDNTAVAQVSQVPAVAYTGATVPPVVTLPGTEEWNGLPAPWEPLPTFLTAPVPGNIVAQNSATMGTISSPSVVMPSSVSSAEGAPLIQRAPTERSLPETVPAAASDSPAPVIAPVAPDLDALARQVYDKLKRRLAAEQRQRLR